MLSIAFLVAADQSDARAWEDATWALEALHRPEYIRKQTAEDLEEFFVQMVYEVVKNPKMPVKEQVKTALAQVKTSIVMNCSLLSFLDQVESQAYNGSDHSGRCSTYAQEG